MVGSLMVGRAPRARVLIDNDYSGDPDDLIQTAHHLLSPSVEIAGIIASHLSVDDPWDRSTHQAANAEAKLRELLAAMAMEDRHKVWRGSELGIVDLDTPQDTPAARAIIAEAMREDSTLPLFFAAGAGLTELASAWLLEPRIGERLKLVWIGGLEPPGIAEPPPNAKGPEYNLRIDIPAAQVIFNRSDIEIWQVPRSTYRKQLMTHAELEAFVRPQGRLGEYLADSIERVANWVGELGLNSGETYTMGDSPLVTLTALTSSWEAETTSSSFVTRPTPNLDAEGNYVLREDGRPMRIYTDIDQRLTFSDFFAKLQLFARRS